MSDKDDFAKYQVWAYAPTWKEKWYMRWASDNEEECFKKADRMLEVSSLVKKVKVIEIKTVYENE